MSNPKTTRFLTAYNACHEPFVKYCSALSFGKMDAEDLVQDVLLSAFQNFEKLQGDKPLLHYLIRAAKNRSISNWRKTKYKVELIDLHAERLTSKDVTAEKLLEIQNLYKALDQLPSKQKHALILFEISGFSMKEIAMIQQSTEGAIKTKISRGRTALKAILTKDETTLKKSIHNIKSLAL